MDGIIYRTNDVTRWNAGKGSDLDAVEVDLNFWELYSRLKALETSPPIATSISNISVVGTQMQFNMSDGSHFGPFTLPIATFEFRGDFVGLTPYYELDLITVPSQGLFLVRIAHTAAATFDPAATDGLGHALYLKVFGTDTFIYDFGWFYPGRPGNGIETGAAMAGHVLVRTVTLPAGLPGSKAKLLTASATALSFPLMKNTTSIGSIDFAIGATDGTFTFAADVACAIDDAIRLIRPTTIDTVARELSVTILGNRT